jgi:hypothetical protein
MKPINGNVVEVCGDHMSTGNVGRKSWFVYLNHKRLTKALRTRAEAMEFARALRECLANAKGPAK